MIKLKPLLISLVISLGVGGLSALLTQGSMEQYRNLKQPPLSPPGWVFPVVWTVLFVLMGIAAYLVWMRDSTGRNGALALYGAQLFFNFFWSILFFRFSWYLPAFFWLAAMIILILIMIFRFFQIKPLAAYLQIPYLFWCLFAAYLNFGVYWLN